MTEIWNLVTASWWSICLAIIIVLAVLPYVIRGAVVFFAAIVAFVSYATLGIVLIVKKGRDLLNKK